MKKSLVICVLSLVGMCSFSQSGMDYNGPVAGHWSGLEFPNAGASPGGIATNNNNSEKALGVFQSKVLPPVSFLEVNTDNAHMPFPLAGLSLSDVFSTNSGNAASFWRMKTSGTEYGLLYNNANAHFGIQATDAAGDIFFNAGGANERMRIFSNGIVSIGNAIIPPLNQDALRTFGPIQTAWPISSGANPQTTILYGYTPVTGNPFNAGSDGFRLRYDWDFLGTPNFDAFIIEKTDGQGFNPDGCIAFTNNGTTGAAANQVLTMMLAGNGRVGIGPNFGAGAALPQNRLEIESTAIDPYGLSGSGLRFNNLNCLSPTVPQCSPANPVFLSVDNDGDVILVNGAASTGIGAYCPPPGASNPLTNNYEIPFGNFNIYYPGQGLHGVAPTTTDAMGLGYTCSTSLPAKFSVLQDNSLSGGVGLATESTAGGSFINRDVSSAASKKFYGIEASSDGVQTPGLNISNIGGSFLASNGLENRAVQGRTGGAPPASGTNYAGHFSAAGPGLNSYGVYAKGVGASGNNYGVYGESGGSGNGYAIYGSNINSACLPNQWAGYFDGDVNINGSGCSGTYALTVNGSAFLSSGTLWSTSDKNFKKDIKKLENVTDKINKLTGYTYNFKTEEFPDKKFEKTEQIGLIAQELKEVFPQLVTTDAKGFMAVNYQGMVPVLLEAIKEQQKQINELKTLVKNSTVTNPNGAEEKAVNSVNLADIQSIILDQNVPNPFAEQTTISYTLTKGVQKAQMLFYNAEGKLINSSELKTTAGKGQLNVFASDLSNGIYTYTLVVDGKVIDSKRMLKGE